MFSVDARLVGRRGPQVVETYTKLLDELKLVPGAHSVSISAVRPVSDSYYFIDAVTKIEDRVLQDDQMIRVAHNYIAPGYFATLGIPLLAGRDFDLRDDRNAPKVVIIIETMARRHFAKQNPIGRRITLATLLLIAMAFAAGYLPAARASRIDPITALRHE